MRLETARVCIRDFCMGDLEALCGLLADPEVMRYLEPVYSKEQTRAFLKAAGLCKPPLIYAVEDHAGNFVGYVIYHAYEKESFELGWVLGREHWRKGYAQELTAALIRHAQGRTDALVIECAPEQTASIRLALKNGFCFEAYRDGCNVYRIAL